ncbi:MAG: Phosphomannomutase/phosphoglucomutase [Verrucomicrobiota bacterium]
MNGNPFIRLGAAGLHGEIGGGLNPRNALGYCSALATWLDGGPVVIASDTRFSSPMLRSCAIAAFSGAGIEVLDAGLCTSAAASFLVRRLGAAGGLVIGAGHHGKGWNALQPLGPGGCPLGAAQSQELLDIYHARRYRLAPWNELGQVRELPSSEVEAYVEALVADLDVAAIAASRLKVVVDLCNGAATQACRLLFDKLGIELIPINDEASGHLPHEPEPRPRAAYQARSLLSVLKADIGFVLDSAGNRVSLVASDGETLSEELTLPIIASALLRRPRKDASRPVVVTNICTTRSLDLVCAAGGAELVKTAVGFSPVLEAALDRKALLAGDGVGAVAYPATSPHFDALHSLGIILEALALEKCSSAELVARLPRFAIVKTTLPCDPSRAYVILRSLRDAFPDARRTDSTDGLRLDWDDGWIHLRASETEPVVRLISEWPSQEEARDRAEKLRRLVARSFAQG